MAEKHLEAFASLFSGSSSDSLPTAVDAESPLSPSELNVLREQYHAELSKGFASVQSQFNFAWGSVKSKEKVEVAEGVRLLMDLYRSEPSRRRECLYFLAMGHYKLGNFEEARRYNGLLLAKEPHNIQAQSLSSLIEKAVAKEGFVGLAIATGAATVLGVVLAAVLKKRH